MTRMQTSLAPSFDLQGVRRIAFDLEIADVFDLAPGEDLECHAPFSISVAAIASDRGTAHHWFRCGEAGAPERCLDADGARAVLHFLRDAQTRGIEVVVWNGLSFDLRWLGVAAGEPKLAAEIALDLYDPMFQFVMKRGFPIGLAAVADGFGIEQKKLMHGSEAPLAWQRGEHQRVLDYVRGDCELTLAVAERIAREKSVRWRTKRGMLSSEPLPSLRRAREVMRDPLPDQSWMDTPMPLDKFHAWTREHCTSA